MSKPGFGFSNLDKIKPDQNDNPEIDIAKADAVAEKAGFTSREPTQRIYKHSGNKEATIPLSLRPSVSVGNRFIAYCKLHRYSYHEGLEELMKKAGI